MKQEPELVKVLVRLPVEVHDWLNEQRKMNMASKNSQIISCIRAQMTKRDKE